MTQIFADLHSAIFDQFITASISAMAFPTTISPNKNARIYAEKFAAWQDMIAINEHALAPETAAGHDRCWVFSPNSRNGARKRRHNAKLEVFIVALSPQNHVALVTGSISAQYLDMLLKNPGDAAKIISGTQPGSKMPDFNRQSAYAYLPGRCQEMVNLSSRIGIKTDFASTVLGVGTAYRQTLHAYAMKVAREEMTRRVSGVMAAIDAGIDQDALEFSNRYSVLAHKAERPMPYGSVDFYNHVVSAAVPQARDYRKGALTVLLPLNHVFMGDRELWARIDTGMSVFKALGEQHDVSPATIRRMVNDPVLCTTGPDLPDVARYLDKIDVRFWPQNETDLVLMRATARMAAAFGKTFSRSPHDIFKNWVADCVRQKRTTWREIATEQCRSDITHIIKSRDIYEIGNRQSRRELRSQSHRGLLPADFIERLQHKPAFWERVTRQYENRLSNIKDMKDDVIRRLVVPAIALSLETHGIKALSTDVMKPVSDKLATSVWQAMSPSDQAAASAYWHSERVHFQDRFQSIATTRDEHAAWCTLIMQPYSASNGVTAHPLYTAAMLMEEGGAMSHCVGGYAYNCFKHRYHIFSLRDRAGQRLSTLTVQDYFDENGQRLIRDVQNKSYKNGTPSPAALAAAKEITARVNDARIRPDWEAVDASKAAFLAKEVDNAAGYDFRDESQRARIFELFSPCLPRKLTRKAGDFDALAAVLGVQQAVDEFVGKFDFSRGGLRRVAPAALPAPARLAP